MHGKASPPSCGPFSRIQAAGMSCCDRHGTMWGTFSSSTRPGLDLPGHRTFRHLRLGVASHGNDSGPRPVCDSSWPCTRLARRQSAVSRADGRPGNQATLGEDRDKKGGKADMQHDWTKPAAKAIPEGGFFKEAEQGRYGPVFPKTPACYGFTIIAKIKPGTEQTIRRGRGSRKPSPACPTHRGAQVALPALGALRHWYGNVLHVSGHLRHQLR